MLVPYPIPHADGEAVDKTAVFGVIRKFPFIVPGCAGSRTVYPVRRSDVQPQTMVTVAELVVYILVTQIGVTRPAWLSVRAQVTVH